MPRRLLLPFLLLTALVLAAYPRLHRRLLRYQGHRAAQVATAQIESQLRDGDLIFHTSLSAQSRAIQLATHSAWSHCGILYQHDGKWQVFEAVQPVKLTPLADWVARGQGGHFATKRLRDAATALTPAALARLKAAGQPMLGIATTCILAGPTTGFTAPSSSGRCTSAASVGGWGDCSTCAIST